MTGTTAWNGSTAAQTPLRFGTFMPPMHPVGQNPTLSMRRDVELIQHLDRLGFDEAWIGEHHSSGFETIASPEVFIGHVAALTERIKLGTGVNSLPYHHPLILADRIVMLDHLTRGRMMFGVGPGQLTSDATMLGIDTAEQRRMMEESFDVIMRLFGGEIVSVETDWFTLREGRLQLRPYSNFDVAVAASISPSGPKIAGRYGVGMISVAATSPAGFENLAGHWKVMEEQARDHGRTVDRSKWRMMGPLHIAESVAEATKDCEYGFERVMDYLAHVVPTGPIATETTNYHDRIKEMNDTGGGVIGTPEMAIAQIQRLIDQSGGFGAYLTFGGDLADQAQTLRSYELFAQYVMPHFQGQLAPTQASYDWIVGSDHQFVKATISAIDKARAAYAVERGEPAPIPLGG
jgi:limonene 1,2-monooxygenase